MSNAFPLRPELPWEGPATFGIVLSVYNGEFTRPMAENARRELLVIAPHAFVEIVEVPGSFEIPLAVRLLAGKRIYQAIIALGVIFQGETMHAEFIARSVTDALQRIALDFHVPVIHEVLLLSNAEQAMARCLGHELNRGIEAARSAVRAAYAIQQISTG